MRRGLKCIAGGFVYLVLLTGLSASVSSLSQADEPVALEKSDN
jgi:hypothetical protein